MYHRVTERNRDRLSVHPSEFERQIDYLLGRNYRILDLSDLSRSGIQKTGPRPAVILTFDDGYLDFYENVFPVLKARRLPAAVFIIVGLVEGNVPLHLARGYPDPAAPLTWEMLKEMSLDGVTVGSHSFTHRELPRLNREEAEKEIESSALLIADRLGRRPLWFAYPRGKFNSSLEDTVRKAGYSGAVTVRPGSNRYPLNLFSLRRTEICGEDDMVDFKMKLRGAFDPWHFVWQAFKGEKL